MLLPYVSDRPPRNPPVVVLCFVFSHFLIFALMAALLARGSALPVVWFANLSLVPASLHLRWYAPLTYSFLHEDVFHVSSNMLFLWVFGGSVEEALGWRRFLGLFLVAAIVTGLLQALMAGVIGGAAKESPIVGASGAISAIVGVFAVRFYRSRIRFIGLPWKVPAVLLVAAALVVEMGVALFQLTHRSPSFGTQTASHWAHIGGFILGLIWAQATRQMQKGRQDYLASDAAEEMARGSPLSAVRRWEVVLRSRPEDANARAELAHAWAVAGDEEQSLPLYRAAISALLKAGAKVDASRRFLEMRSFFPNAALEPAAQFSVARALEESGDYRSALAVYEALVESIPDSHEAEISHLRAGVILFRHMDDPEKAVVRLQSFLKRYPESAWRQYAQDTLRAAQRRVESPDAI
jgi:membrane associated rhomboid family serine protease